MLNWTKLEIVPPLKQIEIDIIPQHLDSFKNVNGKKKKNGFLLN